MINKIKIVNLLTILLLLILFIGCDNESNEERDVARLEHMEKEILEIISDLSCQDSTDCQFVDFGVKPCGGPWRYLVYSATHVDNVLLNEKVKAYNEYNNTLNIRYGWISDCSYAIIPVLGCIEGECINNISNLKFHEHD